MKLRIRPRISEIMPSYLFTGHCVTTVYPGEVCDLDSYAVGCDVTNLTATACRCYQPEPEDVSSGNGMIIDSDSAVNDSDIQMTNDSDTMSTTTLIPEQTTEVDSCEG